MSSRRFARSATAATSFARCTGPLSRGGREPDTAAFAIYGEDAPAVLGRLADRGLHDELTGSAYVVIEGVDGRAHHLRFGTLEATGDASIGAVVEVRPFTGNDGQRRGEPRRPLGPAAGGPGDFAGCDLARPYPGRTRAGSARQRRVRRGGEGSTRTPDRSPRRRGLGAPDGPARRVRARPARHAATAGARRGGGGSCRPRRGYLTRERATASTSPASIASVCSSPRGGSR